MSFQFKKNRSLVATLAVIIITSVGGYYLLHLKRSEYPAATFVSLSYKWGVGDTLINSYDSATGHYQYLNSRDSLIKKNVKLRANNIIFIHSKANELDFLKLPNVIANKNTDLKSSKVLRYEMVFNYEQHTKKIVFITDYDENQETAIIAAQLQKIVAQTISEAEERYSK